jgi:hypothetical protein
MPSANIGERLSSWTGVDGDMMTHFLYLILITSTYFGREKQPVIKLTTALFLPTKTKRHWYQQQRI